MSQIKDTASGRPPGNPARGTSLPHWLDSRTIAILTTTLTVALAIGVMIQTAFSGLAQDIGQIRQEIGHVRQDTTSMGHGLSADIENVRLELSADIENVRSELGADIESVRSELSADIENVRLELSAGIDKVRDELGAEIKGLDTRLRTVEIDVAAIRERLGAVEVDVSAIRTAMTGFDARLKAVEGHTHADDRNQHGV